jgi:hypothetical protein
MDDKQWGAAEELVFYDCGHNEYPVKLHESQ